MANPLYDWYPTLQDYGSRGIAAAQDMYGGVSDHVNRSIAVAQSALAGGPGMYGGTPTAWTGYPESMPLNSYPSFDYRTNENGGYSGNENGGYSGNENGGGATNNQQPDPVYDPSIWYEFNQPIRPTLHDQGMQMAPMMNNWLMNGYFNALPNAVQDTNDAWAQQMNINARNSLLQQLIGSIGGMGGNGGGFRDTASRQQAGNGQYTTSIDAGGLNPNVAQGAVSALQNAHPGTNSQHGDLRRSFASQSANNLNRTLDQNYAQQQGGMEAQRAPEGRGLMGHNMKANLRNMQNAANWRSLLQQRMLGGR